MGQINLYDLKEYNDNNSNGYEFKYDPNGNMVVDKDRKIVAIKFNLLNLPDVIQFSNGNQIKNRYASDGRKLGTEYFTQLTTIQPLAEGTVLNQVYQANVVDQTGTAYIGNFEYKTYWNVPLYTTLKKVFNTEGYVDEYKNNKPYSGYVYFRKDHLGNNREVWRAGKPGGNAATTIQRTWYYPGGLPWNYTTGTGASVQSYKYNSKEFIEMHGFDTYDYGARGYYPALGRFMTIDPMAEKYYSISPYAYCAGDPVNRIDPDGMEWKNDNDRKIAEQLQQQIANRDNSLAIREQKINAKIDKIENDTKLSSIKRDNQIAKQRGKLDDVQTQRMQLSNLDKGINQLANSKTSFTYNTVEPGTTATLSSMNDGTVIINNYGTTGNRAHETTHAIQYDIGQIKFNPLGSNNTIMYNPMGLEIKAYATEYSLTNGIVPSSDVRRPGTVFGITPQWLYGIKDQNSGIYIYRPENYK